MNSEYKSWNGENLIKLTYEDILFSCVFRMIINYIYTSENSFYKIKAW